MNRIMMFLLVCIITWIPFGRAFQLEAGANSNHKIAVHAVAHGLACKSIPTFTECSQIVTTYSDSGDIDVVPVFFDLSEYTVVEFGLTWPEEWGSCAYTPCTPTINIGGITNPGDGIASAWSACQNGWSVSHGYGWLHATGSGNVSIISNPATGDYGVVDCAPSPGPYYDRPETTFAAGVAGASGDEACGAGGRDGGEGLTYTLTIAPGNYLFIYGHEFHGEVLCTLQPGDSLRIGGLPVLPRRVPPPKVLSEEELRGIYSQVPFLVERVTEGETWHAASKAYWQRVKQMEQSVRRIYAQELKRVGSRALAERAALDSLDRSLLDTSIEPNINAGWITVRLEGMPNDFSFELAGASRSTPVISRPNVITQTEAAAFLNEISRRLGEGTRSIRIEVLTHNDTILSGASARKALRQIEEGLKGNQTTGPLSSYELEGILAVRRGGAQ